MFVGELSGASYSNADRNTGLGYNALNANNSGRDNTALGYNALAINTGAGVHNTCVGSEVMQLNTTGEGNTAMGSSPVAHSCLAKAIPCTGLGPAEL